MQLNLLMRLFLNISVFILFLFAQTASSQSPYPIVFNKNHGLKSNSIYDIYQDKKGYIWLATGHGLCRFNGKDFLHFKSVSQTMKSGSCIKEDKFGRIWYANFDGFLYYVESDKLKAFPQKTNTGFMNFALTKDFIYLPSLNKLQIYQLETFKLIGEIDLKKNINYAYQNQESFFLITDYLIEINKGKLVKKYTLPFSPDKDFIAPMITKFKDTLCVFSKFNKNYFLFKDGLFNKKEIKPEVNFIQNVSSDNHFLWLNTPNGIFRNKNFTDNFEHYFENINISCVFKDDKNQYWIGTQNQGLYFVPNFASNFDTNIQNTTRLIIQGSNKFIGTSNDQIYSNNQLKYESTANHAVNFMMFDSLNNRLVWASSKLYFYNLNQQKIEKEYIIAIKDLIQLDKKYYAYASSGSIGFMAVNASEKSVFDEFITAQKESKDMLIILKSGLNGKAVAKSGENLYFGTNQGLFLFKNNQLVELFDNQKKIYISQLKAFKNKCFGLGTNDLLYLINQDKLQLWHEANNLLRNSTQKIFLSNNYIYLYDGKELYEYHCKDKNFSKVFSSTDYEVRDVVNDEKNINIVTNKGIISLQRPDKNENYTPFFKLKKMIVDGKIYKLNKKNSFSANSKVLNIQFDYINIQSQENHVIEYMINDGSWLETSINNNFIQLLSLAPDEYKIKIRVKGCEKTLNTLNFIIQKPWYVRWYAFVFYFIIIFSIIYQWQKNQTNKLNEKNLQELEKLELEKNINLSTLKAIKSQMNPHFFFNALNTIQAFILSNDKKQAINYLSKFSTLTRSILEMTEKDNISLAEEIRILNNYLEIEQARFHEDFEFDIKSININEPDAIKIPTMIIQPYIENAVKHGLLHKQGLKMLHITFEIKGQFLTLKIEDNGIGRQKSSALNAKKNKDHQSFATQAIENRIQLINKNNKQKITIKTEDKYNPSGQPLGTIVSIFFPLY